MDREKRSVNRGYRARYHTGFQQGTHARAHIYDRESSTGYMIYSCILADEIEPRHECVV